MKIIRCCILIICAEYLKTKKTFMRKIFYRNAFIVAFASLFIVSCQKSILEPTMPEEARTAVSNQGRGVTPYQFERINEQNFSSQGWRKQQINNSPTGGPQIFSDESDYVQIVCGPENDSDPRLIKGSITMNLPTSADPTLRRIRLRKAGYSGTRLADLTELKYSTYVVYNCPTNMVLQIDINGDENIDFNIWYDPRTDFQEDKTHPVELNKWQQWDALAGTWHPEFTELLIPASLSIAQLVEAFPNARIIDVPPLRHSGEGVRFTIGGTPRSLFDNTIGYFDALIIGTKNEQHSTFFDFMCDQSDN